MARWTVTVYDDSTEGAVREHGAYGIEAADVRRLWNLAPSGPIGELEVLAEHRSFVDAHLDRALDLRPGETALLSLLADYPGEVVSD
jgi:hypothetical protein